MYKHWYKRMHEKHGDNIQGHVSECRQPDLDEFLNHQFEQCDAAEGDDDPRWRRLHHCASVAREALEGGDTAAIAMAFYRLGESVEALDHPTKGEHLEQIKTLFKKTLADEKRQRPTRLKQAFIKVSQEEATRLWSRDHNQEIRLAEMCDHVYKLMLGVDHEHLPGESSGLKKWLRPVAPEYAKAPGRPKK